MNYMMI